jgi:hypothetical protein
MLRLRRLSSHGQELRQRARARGERHHWRGHPDNQRLGRGDVHERGKGRDNHGHGTELLHANVNRSLDVHPPHISTFADQWIYRRGGRFDGDSLDVERELQQCLRERRLDG